MMRCLQISQSTDTKVLLIPISEALFICEEGFFTEWKLGNTPNEKPRNPAFGGVFFCLIFSRCHKCGDISLSEPAVIGLGVGADVVAHAP